MKEEAYLKCENQIKKLDFCTYCTINFLKFIEGDMNSENTEYWLLQKHVDTDRKNTNKKQCPAQYKPSYSQHASVFPGVLQGWTSFLQLCCKKKVQPFFFFSFFSLPLRFFSPLLVKLKSIIAV